MKVKARTLTMSSTLFRAGETMTVYQIIEAPKIRITGSASVYRFLQENEYFQFCNSHETMYAILLNRRNFIIGVEKLGEGSNCGLTSDNHRLFAAVAINKASYVILSHNHPSGTLYPSEPDKRITKAIKEGLKVYGCGLADHVIYTTDGYFSFADEGMI